MNTHAHLTQTCTTVATRMRPARTSVQPTALPARRDFRSLFISDLHLGSGGARAVEFLRFFRGVEVDNLYMVGDIFDIWHVGSITWTPVHDQILLEFAARASRGTRIVYLPGNHDAAMRSFIGIGAKILNAGVFEIADHITHQAADGKRYLVLHGDQCDMRLFKGHMLTRIGSRLDSGLRQLDVHLKRLTGHRSHRSPAWIDTLRAMLNTAMLVGSRSEIRLAQLARKTGHHGVICGHFHQPAMRDHDGTAYINCGDWIDNRSAVAEHRDGRLQLLQLCDKPSRSRVMERGLAEVAA